MPLNVAFMGTPEFARVALEAIHHSPHRVVCVISQPDRRSGRGKALVSPPCAAYAKAEGLPLHQPERCGTAAFRQTLSSHAPDIAVVAAYGHILGPKALAIPRLGCLNIHASLLPRWRGASPITAAIDAGDAETGVSIMQMDPGMDTGPVLLTASTPIAPDDTTPVLHDRLAAIGARLILEALAGLEEGTLQARPQQADGVTYAGKLDKGMADLDWGEDAAALARHIRAFTPWPGSRAAVDGRPLRIHPPAHLAEGWSHASAPGTILEIGPAGLRVACGGGTVITLTTLQAEGRRPTAAADFARGFPLEAGMRLDPPLS